VGRTPTLTGFGRHRDKVSTIAAISVAPARRRMGLYWRTDPEHYIDTGAVAGFLREVLGHLRGRVIVVWDGGSNHKGPAIRAVTDGFPRLELERLPGYAPDLNPVEMVWSYLKYGRLANLVPRHVRDLDHIVADELAAIRARPDLLRALWAGSKLPMLETTLLS
jgi:transposase